MRMSLRHSLEVGDVVTDLCSRVLSWYLKIQVAFSAFHHVALCGSLKSVCMISFLAFVSDLGFLQSYLGLFCMKDGSLFVAGNVIVTGIKELNVIHVNVML